MRSNSKIALIAALIITVFALTACKTSIPADWREWASRGDEESAYKDADKLQSKGVYVVDVYSGEEIFAKNETEKMNPASTVKMMTALVTLEEIGEGDALNGLIEVPRVVFTKFDTDDPNTQGGSMAGLWEGQDNLSYLDALYGLMLPSGNDAANALAYNVGGGSIHTFVELMNSKAEEIGCVNTSFSNPHGLLEEGTWSCAYDLALIARYAYEKFETFGVICGSAEYVMPGGNKFTNSNGLMRKSNPLYRNFVKGVKSGTLDYIYHQDEEGEWIQEDGIVNLVSLGEIENGGETRTYIVATMEAPFKFSDLAAGESHSQFAYADHAALYDWLIGGDGYVAESEEEAESEDESESGDEEEEEDEDVDGDEDEESVTTAAATRATR